MTTLPGDAGNRRSESILLVDDDCGTTSAPGAFPATPAPYVYDVAAYKFDRLLDWQMVPTAVIAEVEGDEGALSDWVENAINERDREEKKVPFAGYCKKFDQYRMRFVFDILIYNEDRNLTNIHRPQSGISHFREAPQSISQGNP